MSNFNWCHGPNCHKRNTTNRVRGVKGSKVLRTIKVALNSYRSNSVYKYFCDQTCMHDFINTHIEQFVQLHPRTEALETPINIYKATIDNPYWGRRVETKIEVDETRQT